MTIVYIDDHAVYRTGVTTVLKKKMPELILAEFVESEDAVAFIHNSYIRGHKIDLIITDYNHPGRDGLAFAQYIKEFQKIFSVTTPIILLTMHYKSVYVEEMIKKGVIDTYCAKSIDAEELIEVVESLIAKTS